MGILRPPLEALLRPPGALILDQQAVKSVVVPSMQSAAEFIAFETALLSESAATMMPAATKASKSAYSTDEMPLSSFQRLLRNLRIILTPLIST